MTKINMIARVSSYSSKYGLLNAGSTYEIDETDAAPFEARGYLQRGGAKTDEPPLNKAAPVPANKAEPAPARRKKAAPPPDEAGVSITEVIASDPGATTPDKGA
jgi:hypothetical protein